MSETTIETMRRRLASYRSDDMVFPVNDRGPIDGEPVVLLHGFPQTPGVWDVVATELNAIGYRTITPELRGYSVQARPRGRVSYRSSKLVGDVMALVDAAGSGPVHLVGHDWGALVAWSTAAAHPGLVRSLTAVSVPHYAAFVRSLLGLDQLRRSSYIGLFQLPLVPELLICAMPNAFFDRLRGSGMTEERIEDVRDLLMTGALTPAINWYRGLAVSGQRTMSRRIEVPTTLVWGDADGLLGRTGIELTGRHVAASYELVVLPGVGHWVPDEQPHALAHAVVERTRTA